MPPLAPYQEALVVGHVDNGAVRRGQVLPALNLHGGEGGREGTRVRSGAQVWGGAGGKVLHLWLVDVRACGKGEKGRD